MYKSSIEEKLKRFAVILLVIGIIVSVISGLTLMEQSFGIGLIIIISGVLSSIFIYLLLSGFAQLINSTKNIEIGIKMIVNNQTNNNPQATKDAYEKSSNPLRCNHCGKINDDGTRFCVICGKKLLQSSKKTKPKRYKTTS